MVHRHQRPHHPLQGPLRFALRLAAGALAGVVLGCSWPTVADSGDGAASALQAPVGRLFRPPATG